MHGSRSKQYLLVSEILFIGEKIFIWNALCQQSTIYADTFYAVVHVPEFGKMNEQDDWIHHA